MDVKLEIEVDQETEGEGEQFCRQGSVPHCNVWHKTAPKAFTFCVGEGWEKEIWWRGFEQVRSLSLECLQVISAQHSQMSRISRIHG
jgi:hypothetical protein